MKADVRDFLLTENGFDQQLAFVRSRYAPVDRDIYRNGTAVRGVCGSLLRLQRADRPLLASRRCRAVRTVIRRARLGPIEFLDFMMVSARKYPGLRDFTRDFVTGGEKAMRRRWSTRINLSTSLREGSRDATSRRR